ncbi:MAG: hypothetical protein Q8O79_00795 [Pseudomonadota bacterium]|nr:hypothetical protein [Pseudomonadota bacterium]
MYADLQETFELPVGLDIGGKKIKELTLRPVVVGDFLRIAELQGDDPTIMDVDMARWCCQVVKIDGREIPPLITAKIEGDQTEIIKIEEAPALTMAMLKALTEPDYQALTDAADRVKKKLLPASAG